SLCHLLLFNLYTFLLSCPTHGAVINTRHSHTPRAKPGSAAIASCQKSRFRSCKYPHPEQLAATGGPSPKI
uniref:Secreted protein n=1 Tax=Taeniopygia guttata TaxID=59729 RepID=A0A674GEA2_TAEGU